MPYEQLKNKYEKLWNNRLLSNRYRDCKQALVEAITIDLKDEATHPRVRRSSAEKFFLAIKRIESSSLSAEDKLSLISLHIQVMESLHFS